MLDLTSYDDTSTCARSPPGARPQRRARDMPPSRAVSLPTRSGGVVRVVRRQRPDASRTPVIRAGLARRLRNAEFGYTFGLRLRPQARAGVPVNRRRPGSTTPAKPRPGAALLTSISRRTNLADHLVFTPRGFEFAPHAWSPTRMGPLRGHRIMAFYRASDDLALLFAVAYENRIGAGDRSTRWDDRGAGTRLASRPRARPRIVRARGGLRPVAVC